MLIVSAVKVLLRIIYIFFNHLLSEIENIIV